MTSHYLQHGPFHAEGVTELLSTRPGDEVVHHAGGFIAPREQSPLPGGHAAAVVPGLNVPSSGGNGGEKRTQRAFILIKGNIGGCRVCSTTPRGVLPASMIARTQSARPCTAAFISAVKP